MQKPIDTQFDWRSTALEVASAANLVGKLAVITGGSTGLGKETARALASAGADLFLGARGRASLEAAKDDLAKIGPQVHTHVLDLMDPASVEAFAQAVLSLGRPIDILVNNAGIMACPLSRNAFGVESQLATNFLGHALLTSLLAPALVKAGRSRLVSLSSSGHHRASVDLEDLNFEARSYDRWEAYGQSKTADALLAVKVARELGGRGVTALAVHPGAIMTDLMRFLTDEERAMVNSATPDMSPKACYKTVQTGAATSIWAATAPELDGKGPLYLEDCGVAPVIDQPDWSKGVFRSGVMRFALDPELADRLWAAGERLLDRKLPL